MSPQAIHRSVIEDPVKRKAECVDCAFANGGGCVVIGVKPDGQLVGQQVSEQTFHEIAAARDRFEPPIEVESVELATGRTAIMLTGEAYARTGFEALHARICAALRGERPRVLAAIHLPGGGRRVLFEDGSAEETDA